MKKRNMMLGSAFLLVALLVAGGTMAWFTDEAEAENKFKAGTVKIVLNDKTINDNEELVDFPKTGLDNVNPGDEIPKLVSVKNDGTKRAYVRIKLVPKFDTEKELDMSVITYPILANWIEHDGYYYYKDILLPGVTTTNLIEEVLFAGKAMGNEYQGVTFTLDVEAEAIQVTNGAMLSQWLVDPADIPGLELE